MTPPNGHSAWTPAAPWRSRTWAASGHRQDACTTPPPRPPSAQYANGVELICKTAEPGFGVRFEGTEGWIEYGYQGLKTYPETLKSSQLGPNEIHLPVGNPQRTEESGKYHIPDHVRNFLDCIKSRHDPVAPVETGHRSATVCHLGNIAMQLHRKVRWDPVKEEFPGDEEANQLLSRSMRAPWTLA